MSLFLIIAAFFFAVLAVVILAFLALVYVPSPKFEPLTYEPIQPDYWPTKGFIPSSPEVQGMDSQKLLAMLDYYAKENAGDPEKSIDSITVVRNGYLVADIYFNPLYPRDTLHVIHSCAKSIVSMLVGIAIDQGFIAGVHRPLVDFFPSKASAVSDERMTRVTVKDLLTMQSGIRSQDSYLYQWRGLFATMAADDWVAHILGLPMDCEPGTRFDYSNLSSFLLSAIIQQTTGTDTLSFARKNLFAPLGIEDVYWETSPQGIYTGYARMWLKPHDMAKLGLLYLQQGQWNGCQIVPSAWIRESLVPHAFPKNYVDVLDENGRKDNQASRTNWISAKFFRPFADGYGYQWWLDKNGRFNALGTSGQYIMVAPQENVVVAVTNASSGMGTFLPAKLIKNYILPAVVSATPIPVNREAQQELAARSGPPEMVLEPQPIPDLPLIARAISGKTYTVQDNRWNYNNFQFIFDPHLDYARFSYTAKVHDAASFAVGLDGTYRFSDTDIGCFAALGSWTAPHIFELFYQQIGYSAPVKFVFTFNKDQIDVQETGLTGSLAYSGQITQTDRAAVHGGIHS